MSNLSVPLINSQPSHWSSNAESRSVDTAWTGMFANFRMLPKINYIEGLGL